MSFPPKEPEEEIMREPRPSDYEDDDVDFDNMSDEDKEKFMAN